MHHFVGGIKIRDKWVARAGRMGASYRKSSIRAVFIYIYIYFKVRHPYHRLN